MRRRLADLGRKRKRNGLRHDEALAGVEVGPHPVGVDLESAAHVGNGGERAGHDQCQRREGWPFRLPGAGGAFMFLHLRRQDGGGQVRRHGRGGERDRGANRISLMRHGRRAALAGARRLERFAHFGLHQERHVARDLAAGAGEDRQARGDVGEPIAMAVPRRFRQGKVKQGGEPVRHVEPAIVERRKRAGGTAKLQHQGFPAHPPQPFARAAERGRVAGNLQAERHRQRVLQPSPGDSRLPPVAAGELGETVDGALDIGHQRIDNGAQFEHQRGVDDVLAGRAPMHVAGGIGIDLGDFVGQRFHQRYRHVAGLHRLFGERREIVAVGLACFGDRIGGGRRNDADSGFGAHQSSLDVEHALQPGAVVDDKPHRRAGEQRRQQGGNKGARHGRATHLPARTARANPHWAPSSALAEDRQCSSLLCAKGLSRRAGGPRDAARAVFEGEFRWR